MMYIKRITGYITSYCTKGLLDIFKPVTQQSSNWNIWVTQVGPHTCDYCYSQNGVVLPIGEDSGIPVHPNCHCKLNRDMAIVAGNATKDGENGADYWLKHYGKLPDYYVSRDEYIKAGWKSGKPPVKWFPGKMMYGGIYDNDNGKLPSSLRRIWYEADINYYEGRRNGHRIYFSNDGLIFVSYDHAETFYEII